MRRRLVLFDIDGTLVTDHGASRSAFHRALEQVYGYDDDVAKYDFSGRTDPQIARMILRDAAFTDDVIDEHMPELWNVYLAGLERNAASGHVEQLPGIRAVVERLATMEHVTLALLTGNIEPGARLKLAPPDLNRFFAFGAFGSDSADRVELPPIAVARARELTKVDFAGEDVVIIGDSIYDVRCGRPYGATTIAVASGKTHADLLRAEDPRHFFESAEDVEGMLAAILG